MAELQKTAQAAGKKVVAEVLKPEQAQRFAQIERQQAPLQALADPEVQGKLNLDDAQKTKIAAMHDALQKEQRGAFRGGDQADRRERMEKVQAARKEANDKAVALLTDEQKSTWKDLIGAPFELKRDGGVAEIAPPIIETIRHGAAEETEDFRVLRGSVVHPRIDRERAGESVRVLHPVGGRSSAFRHL